jgi:hypothetical protein
MIEALLDEDLPDPEALADLEDELLEILEEAEENEEDDEEPDHMA